MEGLRSKESSLLAQSSIFAGLGLFLALSPIWAQVGEPVHPEILSIFPLGGQPGAELQATFRGHALDGTYALWFDSQQLAARVLHLKTEKRPDASAKKRNSEDSSEAPIHVLKLAFQIPDQATLGAHPVRVLTPGGISNLRTLWVHAKPSFLEADGSHEIPMKAQPLGSDRPVVHGTISRKGEVDYYAFEALKDETLWFEVFSSPAMDPALALYQPTGSWFKPDRPKRVAFNDEPIAYPELSTDPILTHRFETSGRYLVRVSGFLGEGGLDHQYLLKTARNATGSKGSRNGGSEARRSDPEIWQERTWKRPLRQDRMKILRSRLVAS